MSNLKPVQEYPAVLIVGPTASGKSQMGLDVSKTFRAEIISCDAMQIYRGMDIGTAKPPHSERSAVPHHLIDLKEPNQPFSAGDYQRHGREALAVVRARRALPVVVGGTGFYVRALVEGLFEGPGRFKELRTRLTRVADRRGSACMHRALKRVDPAMAESIAPSDRSRVIRACELYLATGKTMTWWQKQQPADRLRGYRWLKLAIAWPRDRLYQRINTRVETMFARGFREEVQSLVERYPKDCNAFKAIGYSQVIRCLQGEISLAEATEQTKQETRRYAKRQMTWFRGDPSIRWLEGARGEDFVASEATRLVSDHLL